MLMGIESQEVVKTERGNNKNACPTRKQLACPT
jgi:hypothetical protein